VSTGGVVRRRRYTDLIWYEALKAAANPVNGSGAGRQVPPSAIGYGLFNDDELVLAALLADAA
jgi:hypothetical protein